jgi:hypothetical protein
VRLGDPGAWGWMIIGGWRVYELCSRGDGGYIELVDDVDRDVEDEVERVDDDKERA